MPTAAKNATTRGANPTDAVSHLAELTDRMHGLLMERADALMGCTKNSPEETELAAFTDVIEAYERQRWPLGRVQRRVPGCSCTRAHALDVGHLRRHTTTCRGFP